MRRKERKELSLPLLTETSRETDRARSPMQKLQALSIIWTCTFEEGLSRLLFAGKKVPFAIDSCVKMCCSNFETEDEVWNE